MNTEYVVEMLNGDLWFEEFGCARLEQAIMVMNQFKISLPENQFRVVKCEREVVA